MSVPIFSTSIYTYPIPLLADGKTPATTSTTDTSTIDQIREKYIELWWGKLIGAGISDQMGYYQQLKAGLSILDKILDGCKIGPEKKQAIDVSNLEQTFTNLKLDEFYTAAQTIDGKRIDENCREGLLAYRYYLKTIVSALNRIYGYLEDGRKALEALKNETDSDMAHTFITQLEMDEKFIYEEFQTLRTHYKYNADTKQWDKIVDDAFVSQLKSKFAYSDGNFPINKNGEEITYDAEKKKWFIKNTETESEGPCGIGYYKRDSAGWLIDAYGDRIIYDRGANKWFKLDVNGDIALDEHNNFIESTGPYIISGTAYADLEKLRNTKIAYKDSTDKTGEKKDKPLTVFNSVTLLDRLLYIRYYYELILKVGDVNYSVFPNNADTGYPCLPDVKSNVATQDTKNLGALEVFYVGYLIDRDGPINAVSSFFEVKTAALRNNLSLQSQKITALNMYLDFINRGMDVLNQSQSNGKQKVPKGAHNVLTYLCGEKMYNLFEKDGVKYLVVPCTEKCDERNKGKFRLIRADDNGKAFLIGTDGETDSAKAEIYVQRDGDKITEIDMSYEGVQVAPSQDEDGIHAYYVKEDGEVVNESLKDFVLPTQLEVSTIIPGSVKGYLDFTGPGDDDQKHTAMIESWTNALSNKTQYINTAIDTINTDVSVDRSKIDTFDSLTTTFRSRAQDVYLNTTANIRG